MVKKAKFTPKKKKTLIQEPAWEKLAKAKTEEEKLESYKKAVDFAHYEVPDKDKIHATRDWIILNSGWDMVDAAKTVPDVWLGSISKICWVARKLGFIPEKHKQSLTDILLPILKKGHTKHVENINFDTDKEHFLHPDKVKSWVKVWKEYLSGIKTYETSNDPKLRTQYVSAMTYIHNCNSYLRTGIWSDDRYGENREHRIKYVCKALAYDNDGVVKRTKGVFYPDIQKVWGELEYED